MKKEIFTKGLICSIAGAVFAIIGLIGLGLNWVKKTTQSYVLGSSIIKTEKFKIADYQDLIVGWTQRYGKSQLSQLNAANVLLWFVIIIPICALVVAVVKEFIKEPKLKKTLQLVGLILGVIGLVLLVVWLILMLTGLNNLNATFGQENLSYSETFSLAAGSIMLFIGFLLASTSSVVSCVFKK